MFQPFLGGGAVYFGLRPPQAVLSDLNGELIEAYVAVRDEVDDVITCLRSLSKDKETYYRVRAWQPRSTASRAARFIYLNKTCFNGLFRVNLKGEFNVPYGRHGDQLVVCDEDQLKQAQEALHDTEIVQRDFGVVFRRVRAGDSVYLDPPYTTAHINNGFIEYNARVFSWDDQRRLASNALRLVKRGARIAISNADHPSITALYTHKRFAIHRIHRWSTMASKGDFRFPTTELLIVGAPS